MLQITLDHIQKRYGETAVFSDFSYTFEAGKSYALMAPSGFGKTTLLRLILGLETPDAGSVSFFRCQDTEQQNDKCKNDERQNSKCQDEAPAHHTEVADAACTVNPLSASERRRLRFAAVFQEDRLCDGASAIENIRLVARCSAKEAENALLPLLPDANLLTPVRHLSGGQRRRIALVRALCFPNAEALLLDEPFSGLDAASKLAAAKAILAAQKSRTLLLSTHDREDAALLNAAIVQLNQLSSDVK